MKSAPLRICYPSMLVVALLLCSSISSAQNISLTPEELARLQSLTPAQRDTLISGQNAIVPASPQITDPIEVMPRALTTDIQNSIFENSQNRFESETPLEEGESEEVNGPLEQFGYNLFAGAPTTFAPATDIPVPANYIMGPGDTVILQLYGQENETYELNVTREGMLLFPEIGPISVAGSSFADLRNQISEIVSTQLIGQRAAVTLGSLRSIRIFVLGEAFRPGSYTVSALTTMTNALFVSGGITNVGSLRHVQLRRQGETVAELDLYDLLLRGDTSSDVRLLPDDVLFIPPIGDTVGVAGEVIRPAIYELNGEETVLEAVMLAGGTLPTAYPQASRIERIDLDGSRTLIDIDIRSLEGQAELVTNGDVIQIYSILDRLENVVLTEGHLQRPGGFQWQPEMRVSDVIPSLDVLLPNPDIEYALIVREIPPTSTLEVLRINLAAAVNAPDSDADLFLQPRDRVITFAANGDRQAALTYLLEELNAQARFNRPASVVTVEGHVGFPGSYPLLQGMTLGDLIESASGLRENADTAYSLLVRRRDSRGVLEAVNAVDSAMNRMDFDRLLQAGDTLYVFDSLSDRSDLLSDVNEQFRTQADSLYRSRLVSITGQVRFPGEYPLYSDMTVTDLIAAAGGLTESALTSSGEITRYYVQDDSGRKIDHLEVDFTSEGPFGRTMRLAEFDSLVIRQIPNWTEQESILLSGEVVSPGQYSIAKGDTLSSVLRRAGGLTKFADSNASVLLRSSLREQERELLEQYETELRSNISAAALEGSTDGNQDEVTAVGENLLSQIEDAEPLGRLIIDLPGLLAGDIGDDVIVRDGDQLLIPRTRQEVSIMGEVNYPTSHLYDDALSVSDYINLSGGLTQRADASRAYIIKANGQVVAFGNSRWFFQRSRSLEPGDTIVVPFDIEPTNYLATWTSVSQILFNLATSVLAINSVQN